MKQWKDQRCAWLALYLAEGLGNVGGKNLLDQFGTPDAIFSAGPAELARVEGVSAKAIESLCHGRFALDPEKELTKLERCGARILSYGDQTYPSALREIHDPPILLFIRGKDIPVGLPLVAVVGSRNATYYGLKASERFGLGLGQSGVGVVSGLARGIDAAAHWGCLRGGGHTVGVLGTGIDVIYPRENQKLFEAVCERGTLVSEFPPGTPPEPRNFPIRNRIISGMSKGVVIVEATKRSGSLITAGMALEQGREVFAVPGSIDSFKSTGTHSLLKQGARLAENSDDVLEELSMRLRSAAGRGSERKESAPQREMDEIEQKVFGILGMYPLHIDEIVRVSKLDAGRISGVLLKLELEGIVHQLPGKMFVRGQDS